MLVTNNMLIENTTIIGLDLEFSYPAALAFLEKFKIMCESVYMFGYPPMEFSYLETNKRDT